LEICVLAVGRMKAGPERELCERYLERARKGGAKLGLRGFSVEEVAEGRGARAQERIAAEEAALLYELTASDRVISLDARGDLIDSESFAAGLVRDAERALGSTVFVIGGPDGLGSGVLRLGRRISFGQMTWPHQLVRILLAEQLYRATTILSGHPYHRA
jgi:23S rRNA (pseudouridine1915-N3)-methyltransferase